MPHVPRQPSTPASTPAQATTPAQGKKPDKPVHQRLGLETISLRNFEPDVTRLFKHFFGTEAEIDEHTRQLVHTGAPRPGPRAAATGHPAHPE